MQRHEEEQHVPAYRPERGDDQCAEHRRHPQQLDEIVLRGGMATRVRRKQFSAKGHHGGQAHGHDAERKKGAAMAHVIDQQAGNGRADQQRNGLRHGEYGKDLRTTRGVAQRAGHLLRTDVDEHHEHADHGRADGQRPQLRKQPWHQQREREACRSDLHRQACPDAVHPAADGDRDEGGNDGVGGQDQSHRHRRRGQVHGEQRNRHAAAIGRDARHQPCSSQQQQGIHARMFREGRGRSLRQEGEACGA